MDIAFEQARLKVREKMSPKKHNMADKSISAHALEPLASKNSKLLNRRNRVHKQCSNKINNVSGLCVPKQKSNTGNLARLNSFNLNAS